MAKVIIGHRPELTAEAARKVFESHFHDKYDVYKTKMPAYDFVVKKNAWRGVIVKLKQKRGQTYFVFRRDIPPGTAPFTLFLVLVGVWAGLGLQALFAAVDQVVRCEGMAAEVDMQAFDTRLLRQPAKQKFNAVDCERLPFYRQEHIFNHQV